MYRHICTCICRLRRSGPCGTLVQSAQYQQTQRAKRGITSFTNKKQWPTTTAFCLYFLPALDTMHPLGANGCKWEHCKTLVPKRII